MIDFELSPYQRSCQEAAKNFALEHIAPHVPRLENDLGYRLEFFKLMTQAGYFQLSLRGEGDKADTIAYLLALIEIARVDAGIAVAMTVSNMVSEVIFNQGTPQQKERYIGKNGREIGRPFSFCSNGEKCRK